MCRAMPFSARALKTINVCFDVDIRVKTQSRFGLTWSVLSSTTSMRHRSGQHLLWTRSAAPREFTTF